MLADIEKPGDRFVDQSVVKTLAGATVVQVGIIMATISKYFFPPQPINGKRWWNI